MRAFRVNQDSKVVGLKTEQRIEREELRRTAESGDNYLWIEWALSHKVIMRSNVKILIIGALTC